MWFVIPTPATILSSRSYNKTMRRDVLILAGVAIIAIAIGIFVFSSGRFSNNALVASATVVPFTEIVRGSQSEVQRRVNYLITSASQFEELWKMVSATGTPPNIDFKTHVVIAVFAGQRPTAGYAITVAKIEDTNTRMVSIALAEPADDCVVAQAVTTPYEIVAMPTTPLQFAHKDTVTTVNCFQ